MRVLRQNKDSVMAMLEAFVHDPLINWRLLNTAEAATETALARETDAGVGGAAGAWRSEPPPQLQLLLRPGPGGHTGLAGCPACGPGPERQARRLGGAPGAEPPAAQ
jgi:FKBP12-rapamycin complex-associated protein